MKSLYSLMGTGKGARSVNPVPLGGKGSSFTRNSPPSSSGRAGFPARQAPRAGSPDPAPSVPPPVRALLARTELCLGGTGHCSWNCPFACVMLRPWSLHGLPWLLPRARLVAAGFSPGCADPERRFLCFGKITDSGFSFVVSSLSLV